jgi:DNA-binding cell septation regulator SpoVG
MVINNIKTSENKVENTNIIGKASCVINGTVSVSGITIRLSKDNKPYIQMPQMKNAKTGNYQDIAFPLTSEGRKELNNAIIQAFNSPQQTVENSFVPCSKNIDMQLINQKQDNSKQSNVVSRGTMVIDDEFAVKNVSVVINKQGEPFLSLPSSYSKATGKSYPIVSPASKDVYTAINKVAVDTYIANDNKSKNIQYEYKAVTEAQIERLSKESTVKFECASFKDGSFIIRYDKNDSNIVNQALNNTVTQKR